MLMNFHAQMEHVDSPVVKTDIPFQARHVSATAQNNMSLVENVKPAMTTSSQMRDIPPASNAPPPTTLTAKIS